jgi:hypothetical protein
MDIYHGLSSKFLKCGFSLAGTSCLSIPDAQLKLNLQTTKTKVKGIFKKQFEKTLIYCPQDDIPDSQKVYTID